MSHLLAIDPGSKEMGWVFVRRENARVRYLVSGKAGVTPLAIRKLLTSDFIVGTMAMVAIEVVEGAVFEPFRAPDLFLTAEAVGVVEGLAWANGYTTIRMPAKAVRKALVGKASSPKKGLMDKLISDAVSANVIGWPATSNVHVRDAAALAIVANWQLVSRRVA